MYLPFKITLIDSQKVLKRSSLEATFLKLMTLGREQTNLERQQTALTDCAGRKQASSQRKINRAAV